MKQTWKRLERNGKIAVLVSPGWGAGWSTWAMPEQREQAMFDSRLAEAVINKKAITEDELQEWFGEEIYYGGVHQLVVEWLPKGTIFTIEENDGNEFLRLVEDLSYTA